MFENPADAVRESALRIFEARYLSPNVAPQEESSDEVMKSCVRVAVLLEKKLYRHGYLQFAHFPPDTKGL